MMLNKILLIVILGALSVSAYAGFVQPVPVDVDEEARVANGDMYTARFSDNDIEMIGCGIRKILIDEELITFGFCQAREGAKGSETAFCNTQNSDLLDAINAISDTSFITFSWNEDGECTRIGNSTQSFYMPKYTVEE